MSNSVEWWTKVLLGGRGELGGRSGLGTDRYVVLPGRNDPRVVVDASNRAAVADALRRFARARSAPVWGQKLAAHTSPVAARVAPRWSVSADPGQQTLREYLSDVLDIDVRLSISVGPPRPNRKPVVRCYAGRDMIAVAKLGPDRHTSEMVRNEADWLTRLEADPLDEVITPVPLHCGEFGSSTVLVMSALALVSDGGIDLADMPSTVLTSLRERHRSVGIAHSSYWATLETRLSDLGDPLVATACERVRSDSSASSLTTTMWHGDWSPWNVGRTRSGEWCVWDWERTAAGVPTGFDLAHLHHQYGEGLASSRSAMSRLGISPDHIALTWRLYLLELAARHHEADALDSDRHGRVRHLLRNDADGLLADSESVRRVRS